MKRVLLLTDLFRPEPGGLEGLFTGIARHWDADQIEVVALKFASAVDLLPVLQNVIGAPGSGTAGASGGAPGAANPRAGSMRRSAHTQQVRSI